MALTLLDAAADALCLLMMLRLEGERVRVRRVACGALFGALSAGVVRFLRMDRAFEAALWLPIALIMARLARGRWSLRAAGVLLACAGLLGGTVYAAAQAAGSLQMGWLAGGAAALLGAVCAARTKRASQDVDRAEVTVTIHGRSASFEGMVDSGNCLRDYLTHRPVIVLPEAAKARLGLEGAALRPIFADTAGGRLMMDCVTLQRAELRAGGDVHCVQACAAFSPGLAPCAPALIPRSLLMGRAQDTEHLTGISEEGDQYAGTEG